MASNVCSSCGTKITGLKYTHNGKVYCYNCYQNVQQELLKTEQEKQELYAYIKQLFVIAEIPEDVVAGIDRELNGGKKIKGIKNTLWYYYEVEAHVGTVNNIVYTIRDQYENARNYVREINKLKEINKDIDINVPTRTVVIKKSELDTQSNIKRKINYNIEDL